MQSVGWENINREPNTLPHSVSVTKLSQKVLKFLSVLINVLFLTVTLLTFGRQLGKPAKFSMCQMHKLIQKDASFFHSWQG